LELLLGDHALRRPVAVFMSPGPLRPPERTLHLHAGPHKTASTYLQARLHANRADLERLGLRYPTPWREHSHRHLARDLQAGRFQALERLLGQQRRWSGDLLLSAEHFAPLIRDPQALARLLRHGAAQGFALHVISFVRPQAELLNSFYAHGLGRLYGAPSFRAYVRAQLDGRRLRGPARRRWIRHAPQLLDFEQRFAAPLAAEGLRQSYLPFRPRRQDPFAQLLDLLELPPPVAGWRAAPAEQANEQLGRRGLGLAYLLNGELDRLPVRRNQLIAGHGLNRLVEQLRQLARQRGWVAERFDGWQGRLPALLQQRFGASNERFSQRVWGQDWGEVFPPGQSGVAGVAAGQGLVLDQQLRDEARELFLAYRRRLPRHLR
jgi:hypothetical protein